MTTDRSKGWKWTNIIFWDENSISDFFRPTQYLHIQE